MTGTPSPEAPLSLLSAAVGGSVGNVSLPEAKLSSDKFAETLFDVGMAWHRGFRAGPGTCINVVLLAMPLHITAGLDKLADKLTSPHTSNPISFV